VQTNLVLKLKEVFGFDKVNMNFVEAHSIKEGMDLYLDSHNIDLVVMSRHKKSLMERIFSTSNTKMMALYTRVPLMVYHK
jgi:S-adenosylmethionine:tRNA-ribosyltransferase-isomerase (queuine synthetase)